MKIQDTLSTGVGVLLVEVRGVGGQHRIELLEEEKRKNDSDRSFRQRFLTQENAVSDTGKRRHVSNSDLSRQQV